jgi:hypothetical protein
LTKLFVQQQEATPRLPDKWNRRPAISRSIQEDAVSRQWQGITTMIQTMVLCAIVLEHWELVVHLVSIPICDA